MLKVDHHKKIVYEGYGVDMDKLPSRCREITLDNLQPLIEADYRYLHLSEWVLFNTETEEIMPGLSYRSKSDALYGKYANDETRLDAAYVTRRVVDVLSYL